MRGTSGLWIILFALAIIFFLVSLPSSNSIKEFIFYYSSQISAILIFLIILSAYWDAKTRRNKRRMQRLMAMKLRKQKTKLKEHFDARDEIEEGRFFNLAKPGSQDTRRAFSHLDFISDPNAFEIKEEKEEKKEKEPIEEKIVKRTKKETARMNKFLKSYHFTQKNNKEKDPFFDNVGSIKVRSFDLDKEKENAVMIEGEDVSSFSSEWQEFFEKNKGKSPREKLNAMLDYEEM